MAVILLFKNAKTPGAFLRHQVGGQGLRGGGLGGRLPGHRVEIEPTILCDIRSWDYTTFPGHFDMVWASPVCTEYSRALTTRPRRLLQGDALVLSALEIIAHFDPLMWVIENPATGLLKTRPFMERLPWVDVTYCKYGTPHRKQTRLWTNMRWRPRRSLCRPGSRCEAWQDGRHLRAAQRGPRLMEGQYETVSQSRAALQRSCRAVRGDCARGHGGACGAAEHSGLSLQSSSNPTSLEEAHCSMFLHVFLGGATKHQKW